MWTTCSQQGDRCSSPTSSIHVLLPKCLYSHAVLVFTSFHISCHPLLCCQGLVCSSSIQFNVIYHVSSSFWLITFAFTFVSKFHILYTSCKLLSMFCSFSSSSVTNKVSFTSIPQVVNILSDDSSWCILSIVSFNMFKFNKMSDITQRCITYFLSYAYYSRLPSFYSYCGILIPLQ